ncbi:MAG TPA: CARDB domain-containing protein [Chitinophagaceae bacterium]
MKYFFAVALILFMGCNNHPAPDSNVSPPPPAAVTPVDTLAKPGNDASQPPQPPSVTYNDNLAVLDMSNSLERANVNDLLTIYIKVQNTGDDICNMCNVEIRYSLQTLTGTTAFDSDISNGPSAINNLEPGQSGTIKIEFPVKQTGNYTFYLTKLFGVFKGTNSTKRFPIPDGTKTYLTVSQ